MKIAVGGMIASGKSTLVNSLGDALKLPIMEEFEEGDVVFNTLLDWLYKGKPDVEMLLQIYFIHNHYNNQKKYKKGFVVDRDIIEHWIFAKNNLWKYPEVMNMYNGVFMAYLNQIDLPELYIILDIDFDVFLERLKKRGRSSEIDNLDKNLKYFKSLHKDYTDKLIAQCKIYEIPFHVIDVNDKTEDDVLAEALDVIKAYEK